MEPAPIWAILKSATITDSIFDSIRHRCLWRRQAIGSIRAANCRAPSRSVDGTSSDLGNPQICDDNGLDFRFDSPPLFMAEASYRFNQGGQLPGTIKIGGWNQLRSGQPSNLRR